MSNGNHLSRLKQINISRQLLKVNKPNTDIRDEKVGRLHCNQLEKIIELHASDPLMWDSYTLSRIYKVQDNYMSSLTRYLTPITHYRGSDTNDILKRLVKTSFVFDIARFKRDKNYLPAFQNLVFPQIDNSRSKDNKFF